jgi:ribose-phosphate pyrophosphokinase
LRAVFELLKAAGATEIFTVSSHAERDKPMLSAPIPVHNINGFEAIADYFAVKKLQKPLVVAPDKKATGAATLIAEKLGAEVCSMEKTRNLETGEIEHASFDAELSGRDVIIIDDIIASGKTMFGAIELIKKGRPHKVWCACVHLVMESGIEQVMKVADELVATDTIATPFSKTSVVPLLAKRIGKVIN